VRENFLGAGKSGVWVRAAFPVLSILFWMRGAGYEEIKKNQTV
jgi:hypothetical protein